MSSIVHEFSLLIFCWGFLHLYWASLVAQWERIWLPMLETWVQFLGWGDPLEKEMATRSSILAWKIPCREESGGLQSMGSQRVGHSSVTEHAHIWIKWDIFIYLCCLTVFFLMVSLPGFDIRILPASQKDSGFDFSFIIHYDWTWGNVSITWRFGFLISRLIIILYIQIIVKAKWDYYVCFINCHSQYLYHKCWHWWVLRIKQQSWLGRNRNMFSQFSLFPWSCLTLCDPMNCSMPDFPVHHQLPELAQLMGIRPVMPSNHLILCHSLILPSIFPSIRVFSNVSVLRIRWPKYWSFSFGISPSNDYSGLISFRIDWFDLLAVQRILKNLLQHNSSKRSILQVSLLYGPTLTSIHDYWKNHSFD